MGVLKAFFYRPPSVGGATLAIVTAMGEVATLAVWGRRRWQVKDGFSNNGAPKHRVWDDGDGRRQKRQGRWHRWSAIVMEKAASAMGGVDEV